MKFLATLAVTAAIASAQSDLSDCDYSSVTTDSVTGVTTYNCIPAQNRLQYTDAGKTATQDATTGVWTVSISDQASYDGATLKDIDNFGDATNARRDINYCRESGDATIATRASQKYHSYPLSDWDGCHDRYTTPSVTVPNWWTFQDDIDTSVGNIGAAYTSIYNAELCERDELVTFDGLWNGYNSTDPYNVITGKGQDFNLFISSPDSNYGRNTVANNLATDSVLAHADVLANDSLWQSELSNQRLWKQTSDSNDCINQARTQWNSFFNAATNQTEFDTAVNGRSTPDAVNTWSTVDGWYTGNFSAWDGVA